MEDGRPARLTPGLTKKNGPITGATSKRGEVEGFDSGMAMQRADPSAGTATREISRKTESEGHLRPLLVIFLSAFAQPKLRPQKYEFRIAFNTMKIKSLALTKKESLEYAQAGQTDLSCRILHIRCTHLGRTKGVSYQSSAKSKVRSPTPKVCS
jgi:hypothetical protein